jgi:hypothetical protein
MLSVGSRTFAFVVSVIIDASSVASGVLGFDWTSFYIIVNYWHFYVYASKGQAHFTGCWDGTRRIRRGIHLLASGGRCSAGAGGDYWGNGRGTGDGRMGDATARRNGESPNDKGECKINAVEIHRVDAVEILRIIASGSSVWRNVGAGG